MNIEILKVSNNEYLQEKIDDSPEFKPIQNLLSKNIMNKTPKL